MSAVLPYMRFGPGAIVLAIMLGACAPLTPVADGPGIAVARPALARFELDARLSATDGEHAASGRIEWQHAPDADRWTAFSPLGQIVARLDSTPAGAELVLADGARHQAASAATLLPSLLGGTEVPLAELPGWVQGSPRPGAEVRAVDGHGRPLLVIDRGWRIDYAEYHGAGTDALPRRLDISRGDARIRLVIDRWTPTP